MLEQNLILRLLTVYEASTLPTTIQSVQGQEQVDQREITTKPDKLGAQEPDKMQFWRKQVTAAEARKAEVPVWRICESLNCHFCLEDRLPATVLRKIAFRNATDILPNQFIKSIKKWMMEARRKMQEILQFGHMQKPIKE